MTTLGTEKIEALVKDLKEIVIVAKKITADKKIDVSDLAHVIAVIPKIPGFIEDFKAIGEAFEEGKDIDVAEAVALIQKIHSAVKEIEAA